MAGVAAVCPTSGVCVTAEAGVTAAAMRTCVVRVREAGSGALAVVAVTAAAVSVSRPASPPASPPSNHQHDGPSVARAPRIRAVCSPDPGGSTQRPSMSRVASAFRGAAPGGVCAPRPARGPVAPRECREANLPLSNLRLFSIFFWKSLREETKIRSSWGRAKSVCSGRESLILSHLSLRDSSDL